MLGRSQSAADVPEDDGEVMEGGDGRREASYEPPAWGGLPLQLLKSPLAHGVSLESPLRNGRSMETFDLTASGAGHFTIGRLPSCDIHVDHLSISRTHAILQFARDGARHPPAVEGGGGGEQAPPPRVKKERSKASNLDSKKIKKINDGARVETASIDSSSSTALLDDASACYVYMYDLGSKHGTHVNDRRIPAREYAPVRSGDVLRFGDCPRAFTLVHRQFVQMKTKTKARKESSAEEEAKEEEGDEEEDGGEVDASESSDSACDHLNQDEDVDGETPHLLCVDVGTSGLRAYAYDVGTTGGDDGAKGKHKHRGKSKSKRGAKTPVASCKNRGGFYQSLPTLYPQPGWVEQDPYVRRAR
jgi:pSer/pThr/pTyr-binding forkhead associated (FHA) protein